MSEANVSVSVPPRLDVLERVISLQPARLIEIGGFTYIDKDKTVERFMPPTPMVLDITTLSGLASLMETGFEGFAPASCIVQVSAFNLVKLLSKVSDEFGRRQPYVFSTAMKPEREFQFNKYIPQEEFVIALRSQFVQTAALDALVAVAGNLAKETEVRQEDDGFGQRVTARAGVHMLKEVTVKPRVTLQPFRTFLEIEQPEGDFVFRVQHDEIKGNLCALFEADGGLWKLKAMDNIVTWLTNRLRTSEVEGIGSIPIIA